MAGAQRILAQFRHAEIGGFAGNGDVSDEEADLRGIDRKPGWLDVDGEIRTFHFARFDARDKMLDTGGYARAGLAAFLVADEGEGNVAGQPDACPIQQGKRGKRCRNAGFQIAGASSPDRIVDHRRSERILTFRSSPVFTPAIDMNRVGVADEQQALALPSALALRPDVRTARQEFGRLQPGEAKAVHLVLKIGDEVCLVAGNAFVLHGASKKRQGPFAVERGTQAPGQISRDRHHTASRSAALILAGGSEIRPSGAFTPKSELWS